MELESLVDEKYVVLPGGRLYRKGLVFCNHGTPYMWDSVRSLVSEQEGRGRSAGERSSRDGVWQTNGCRHLGSADNFLSGTITSNAGCNGFGRDKLATERSILYVSDVVLVSVRIERQATPNWAT